jgi:hypothetical protein
MKYVISEIQFKKLLEQSKEPSMTLIEKLFKLLNEEKKKHKTRAALIEVIKNFSKYVDIPEEYSLYLLELYLLNYNKDGDYSNLTKGNFIDPRTMKGKTTPNTKANLYTIAKMPFKGSNLEGYWDKDWNGKPYYKVASYRWYPIYIYKDNKWYEVTKRYSSSTSKQMSNANPVDWSDYLESTVYTLTQDEMKMLEQGKSHDEIMKSKLEKLKSFEPELSKRKKTAKTYRWSFDGDTDTSTNIKFKVKSVDIEGDKAIVTVDVYDVIKRENDREVPTPQNYLKGEIPNITPEKVENRIKMKLRDELKDYIGSRFRYTDEIPPETKIDFRFNHIKK